MSSGYPFPPSPPLFTSPSPSSSPEIVITTSFSLPLESTENFDVNKCNMLKEDVNQPLYFKTKTVNFEEIILNQHFIRFHHDRLPPGMAHINVLLCFAPYLVRNGFADPRGKLYPKYIFEMIKNILGEHEYVPHFPENEDGGIFLKTTYYYSPVFNDTATTEIYTRSIVGSVRCV